MKKIPKKIVVGLIVAAILSGLLWFLSRPKNVEAVTDRNEYKTGANLEIAINNNFGKTVCFSSCYPYYLQLLPPGEADKLNWQNYEYAKCQKRDIITTCMPDKGAKTFEINLDSVDAGTNRIMIPVCVGCSAGEEFKQGDIIYSNNFKVY